MTGSRSAELSLAQVELVEQYTRESAHIFTYRVPEARLGDSELYIDYSEQHALGTPLRYWSQLEARCLPDLGTREKPQAKLEQDITERLTDEQRELAVRSFAGTIIKFIEMRGF